MRIKLDENLGVRTADVFQTAGHDVATVVGQSLTSADDAELLTICVREGRALVSLDLDFADPRRFDPTAAWGIAVLRVPDLPGRSDLIAAAMRLVDAMARADLTGHLWVVDRNRVRQYEPPGDAPS